MGRDSFARLENSCPRCWLMTEPGIYAAPSEWGFGNGDAMHLTRYCNVQVRGADSSRRPCDASIRQARRVLCGVTDRYSSITAIMLLTNPRGTCHIRVGARLSKSNSSAP